MKRLYLAGKQTSIFRYFGMFTPSQSQRVAAGLSLRLALPFFSDLFSSHRDWVLQRSPEIIPVLQTQHYTRKSHLFHPWMSLTGFLWCSVLKQNSILSFCFCCTSNLLCLCLCSLPPAPHASVLHLLSGSGAGPGAERGGAACQHHAAQPDVHPGLLQHDCSPLAMAQWLMLLFMSPWETFNWLI